TLAKPAGPVARDEAEVRERLDVLDELPAFVRLLQGRLGRAAFQALQESGLLPGNEPVGDGLDAYVDAVAPLGECALEPLHDRAIGAADRDDRFVRAVDPRRDDRAVDDEMWA